MKTKRIFLSPPHLGGGELEFVKQAFKSNYIAPLGPQVDAFEKEFSEYTGIKHCLALSSGTAAMHLALRETNIGPGDEVIASTLTFIGSITPVVFEGADLVFVDCDRSSWNMDPELLAQELADCANRGKLPRAVVPTDLYGQCCNLPRILEICNGYGVPVVCDAAEAMGAKYAKTGEREGDRALGQTGNSPCDSRLATYDLHHAGKGARAAVFSFNGNKIITTSGGGMLASDDKALIDHARFLSQQAREPFPHYEHTEIGYNYRMSNVLAGIGRGQLQVLNERVKRRREIFDYYQKALGDVPGIEFMPEPEWSRSNRWLTVMLITPEVFGEDREQVRLALEAENIEARPVWKPMHLQPVFNPQITQTRPPRVAKHCGQVNADFKGQVSREGAKAQDRGQRSEDGRRKAQNKTYPARVVGGEVAEDFFNRGLCLPSGTAMSNLDLDRIIETIVTLGRKA